MESLHTPQDAPNEEREIPMAHPAASLASMAGGRPFFPIQHRPYIDPGGHRERETKRRFQVNIPITSEATEVHAQYPQNRQKRPKPPDGKRSVIQARGAMRLQALTQVLRECFGIARALKSFAHDPMHVDVIWMPVSAIGVEGQHDIRSKFADQRHEPANDFLKGGADESLWMVLIRRAGHPGVPIPQEMKPVKSQRLNGAA